MVKKMNLKDLEKIISEDKYNFLIDGENVFKYTFRKYYYKLKIKFNYNFHAVFPILFFIGCK